MNEKKELLELVLDLHSFLETGKKQFIVSEKEKNTISSSLSFEEKWQNLQQQVLNCTKCRLFRERKKAVFGEGNPKSILMIIGEAPGADEDIQGKPFVGKAGQLLTKMLQAIQIEREKVFITNIIKCRPPNNRDPHPDEIRACESYLQQQIAMIQPQVILTLGRYSTGYILNTKEGITKLRGQFYTLPQYIVVPTFHPSALLRNEEWKYPAWEDLKLLRKILQEKNFYPTPEKI